MQLTICGLHDDSSNPFSFTLIYVHEDGAECLLQALQEVSPCYTNGILLAKIHAYLSKSNLHCTHGVMYIQYMWVSLRQ